MDSTLPRPPPLTASGGGKHGSSLRSTGVANLDFDARVPVPFSVFPSSYKEKTHEVAEQTHEELEIRLPEKAGREGQYSSSVHTSVHLPPQPEPERFSEEEVHYTREEERYRRPGSQVGSQVSYQQDYRRSGSQVGSQLSHHEDFRRPSSQVGSQLSHHEDFRRPSSQVGSQVSHHEDYRLEKYRPQTYSTPHETVEVDESYRPHYSAIDNIERTYRARSQTGYEDSASAVGTTVDPSPARSSHNELVRYSGTADLPVSRPGYTDQVQFGGSTTSGSTVSGYTVASSHSRSSQYKKPAVVEETREYPQHTHSVAQKSRMGYYDEDGRYHSFRKGLHKMADKLIPHRDHHHHSHEVETMHESAPSASPAPVVGPTGIPNTVTIPCHHIRNGDILVLQGRPCQVIRISTSAATGQHRYLGVDLFTKQLHEESSFISHPSPSVVVQTMLGPVLKQYRVLDLADGTVTCMTETGEVKVGVPVLDQSNLWERISRAFNSGRGSVRVLVLSDQGRELAVDVKVVHGASL
ncbi:hypothetical protein DL767_002872 [Monosporascus sp. MG133]|nr:hypothetical protein DL767_002872 [Monosporascus sp. MG133]